MASSLSTWLAALSQQQLGAVLSRRGDVLRGPEPRNLGELADRLQRPGSVFAALSSLNVPCLQAAEALLTLGEPSRDGLAQLLDADPDRVLTELCDRALVWPDPQDRLHVAGAVRDAFPDPLGLGRPARELLADRTVADLHKLQATLGLPRGGNKRAAADSIAQRLGDMQFVRDRIAELPAPAREHLERRARREDADIFYGAPNDTERLLVDRGLLIGATWGTQTYLPAEVKRALRGDGFRAPFTPDRPEIAWDAVGVEAVEGEAGVRAADFAERAATVLDAVAADPVAVLKSGGIGARELARLGKVARTSEPRLILELAGAAGLLDAHGERAMVTPAYDEWREQEPAGRLRALLAAWWQLPSTPTESRDEDGKALPALRRRPPCASCRAGRQALASVAGSAPEGHGAHTVDEVAFAAWWAGPAIHLPRASDEGPPLAWTEAESLGVIARGALTGVGRSMLSGDALDVALGKLLPAATQSAAFGSDLTVVVGGAPSAQMRALLDGSADREGHGAATVWRFSPASIRRALDSGSSAADLERELSDIAAAGLPQPLRYLIGDVARRHGHLRVSAGACCVHSPDEALLAEVVAHRTLRALKLRLLAPTVAVGSTSVGETMSALRAAGYLPLAESPDGTVKLERPGRQRAEVRRSGPVRGPAAQVADPVAVARRLLAQPGGSADDGLVSLTEAALGEWATGLRSTDVHQLAHAIDESLPVRIEYQASTGGYTSRVVSEMQLDPPFLVGWCHLRDAERMFTLSRIQSATAV